MANIWYFLKTFGQTANHPFRFYGLIFQNWLYLEVLPNISAYFKLELLKEIFKNTYQMNSLMADHLSSKY